MIDSKFIQIGQVFAIYWFLYNSIAAILKNSPHLNFF